MIYLASSPKSGPALKPGGRFIATYCGMSHLARIRALLRRQSFHVPAGCRGFYSPSEFENLVAGAGLN